MINQIFPHKFCINLDRRPDRWETVTKQFQKYDIQNVYRWSGIDGRLFQNESSPLKPGELALVRTQRNLYDYCFANNIAQALMFEDDVEFFDDVLNFAYYYKQVPSDWQLLYLGGNHLCGTLTQIAANIYRTNYTLACHAYGVKQDAMRFVIEANKNELLPNDVSVGHACGIFPAYAIIPVLAVQKDDYSDIQNCPTGGYKFLHYGRNSYVSPW